MKPSLIVLIFMFALLVLIIFGIVLYDAYSKTSSSPSATTNSSTSSPNTTTTSSSTSSPNTTTTTSSTNTSNPNTSGKEMTLTKTATSRPGWRTMVNKNPFGDCPFGTCDKFNSSGGCMAYPSGAFHCHLKTMKPFTENGKKGFYTSDTPHNRNARAMCDATSTGELIKKNGQYKCYFKKGNTFTIGNDNYLNVFAADVSRIVKVPMIT